MWRVITAFADLQDGGRVYKAGDDYPKKGEPDLDRVRELSGRGNKLGMPLIEEYEKPEQKQEARKTRKKNAE